MQQYWRTYFFPYVHLSIDSRGGEDGMETVNFAMYHPRYGPPCYDPYTIRITQLSKKLHCWLSTMAASLSGSMNESSESPYYETVKNTFTHIVTDTEFSLSTPRVKLAKDCMGFLQTKLNRLRGIPTKLNEPNMTSFIECLGSNLASILDRFISDGTRSNST